MTALLGHFRRNAIAYVALIFALGAGGGYAVAASRSKTITVCADKRTGVLHLHKRGRCGRRQTRVSWNQQGPQGLSGVPGPQGPPASAAWAFVASNGTVPFAQGKNISAQHTGTGTYTVQVTGGVCPNNVAAPVVTVTGASVGDAFPVASVGGDASTFTVFTGTVSKTGFTAADESFDVSVPCS